ncbi:hypothetical protein B0H19DRAFT_1084706 [Mycena capillaripes]|nr:hypothetical protein B0H19DRAFT_1084706 [Mycena capillaripes]
MFLRSILAINTDPQQRVLLETVVDALDDAGYRPADEGGEAGWNRDRIGMFAASAFASYEQRQMVIVVGRRLRLLYLRAATAKAAQERRGTAMGDVDDDEGREVEYESESESDSNSPDGDWCRIVSSALMWKSLQLQPHLYPVSYEKTRET